ncbi:trypsin-like peptidase domain-containing protein [Rubrolithibacter danxiaensis]|uniref:trypsin-like peptidase domain-containing protein n=1 Tax=Rubrolithibacter danxiaensis TaxID=3390805 RepID=UPI003BF8A6DC
MELLERIEAYLRGEMSERERAEFEQQRRSDFELDHMVISHMNFLKQLEEAGEMRQLSSRMNEIHSSLDIDALKKEILPQPSVIKTLWNKYRMNAAVAASVAIIAVLATMLTTGFFSKNNANNSNYSALRREINKIKKSQHALINNIKEDNNLPPSDPGEFGATGFALSENGYVVTNFHVIKGADSVYVQDTKGRSYKVKLIHQNPAYDIAVLQIIDPDFKSLNTLPYTFKKNITDLGERVYTMGFPKDNPVYGEGYLSSSTGYANDTLAYQVSIPVNPGNSGGPLLDSKGNIIGVITGKQMQSDGVAFATKSDYLLKAIEEIPEDSLDQKLVLNKRNNGLNGLKRTDQIKKLQNYIFMVKVY